MGYMKDLHLADIEADARGWGAPRQRGTAEAVVEACLATLRDRSDEARHALTTGLDLAGDLAAVRRQLERRCWEIVSLLTNEHTPRARALAGADLAACAPHIAYAARRLAGRRAERQAIPLVVDGEVVAHAGDLAEADRWLARLEAAL